MNKLKSSVGFLVLFLAIVFVSQVFAQSEQKTAISKDTLNKSNRNEERFQIVEVMPLFKGKPAEKGFRDYVDSNIKYPKEAKENHISGDVLVEFTIDVDGSLVDAKVVRSVHPLLDVEALRVIQSSPKWTPGKLKRKPVEVRYTFPVNFKL
jgi:TonB family protein